MLTGPLEIDYKFFFKIPPSYSKKKQQQLLDGKLFHTKTPDCTNIQKFFEDCLKGIVIRDDKQVTKSCSEKIYSNKNSVVIKIIEIC